MVFVLVCVSYSTSASNTSCTDLLRSNKDKFLIRYADDANGVKVRDVVLG